LYRNSHIKIAITSQNRKTITCHAGKCRKFWVYEVAGAVVKGKSLLELPIEQSFHANHGDGPHPLDEVNVLISGGMGSGLQYRPRQRGIDALVTTETDPEHAVAAYLSGALPLGEAENHDGHAGHEHHHGHPHQASPVFMTGARIHTLTLNEKESS
jgi:predicted Fe-Mo cluster-binding NifX family protein